MKFLAIGSIVKPLSPAQRNEVMPREVPATLQHYLDGKIEQFWFRQDAPGPVFLMSAASLEDANAELQSLPLTAGGYAQYQLIPVGPLAPLGMLLAAK